MKNLLIGFATILFLSSCAGSPEFAENDPENDRGLGKIIWSISDENGQVVDKGELYNGQFRMDESFKRDTHFLDYRDDGSLRVGLVTWGADTYDTGKLIFQVFYEGVFHPGKSGFKQYKSDDVEIFYDNRPGYGPMPLFLAIPENEPLEMKLENGFTFRIHPGSVYMWVTDRPEDYYDLGGTFIILDEIFKYQESEEDLSEKTQKMLESVAVPEITQDNLEILAEAYIAADHPINNDELGFALFPYIFPE